MAQKKHTPEQIPQLRGVEVAQGRAKRPRRPSSRLV